MNHVCEGLDKGIKIVASTLVVGIFLITLAQVVLRYIFRMAVPWSAEAAQVLLVYTVMFVAAYAVGQGTHFAVGAAIERLPQNTRTWINRLNNLLILIFAIIVLIYGARLALAQMNTFTPALGLPVGLVYMALPIGAVFMCVYALAGLVSPRPLSGA